jgi:molecular chaperone GrpE
MSETNCEQTQIESESITKLESITTAILNETESETNCEQTQIESESITKLESMTTAILNENELETEEVTKETNFAPQEEKIEEVLQQTLTQISHDISQLHNDFKTKIKYDESKERIITSLHNELQEYREDLHFKILRSLALDILSLHDGISTINPQLSEHPIDISSFLQDIEDILARHDFEVYQHDGNSYDRKWQKVQKPIASHQSELNGYIAERLRKGLRYGDRVVRPELVNVYRYVNPEVEEDKKGQEESNLET